METFQNIIKKTVGFAFIYLICESLITEEKYKHYCRFVIGLCMLVSVASPLYQLMNTDIDISLPYIDVSNNISDNIWMSSEEGIKYYALSLLKNNYKQYSFTVRSHKTDGGNIMLYIIPHSQIPQSDKNLIYNTLYEKIGLYCKNVNIYLSNDDSGD